MTMYDIMYESICEQLKDGYITLEEAELLNEAAYDRYVVETSKATKAKRDELYYKIKPNETEDEASNRLHDTLKNGHAASKAFNSYLGQDRHTRTRRVQDEHKHIVRRVGRDILEDKGYRMDQKTGKITNKEYPMIQQFKYYRTKDGKPDPNAPIHDGDSVVVTPKNLGSSGFNKNTQKYINKLNEMEGIKRIKDSKDNNVEVHRRGSYGDGFFTALDSLSAIRRYNNSYNRDISKDPNPSETYQMNFKYNK